MTPLGISFHTAILLNNLQMAFARYIAENTLIYFEIR